MVNSQDRIGRNQRTIAIGPAINSRDTACGDVKQRLDARQKHAGMTDGQLEAIRVDARSAPTIFLAQTPFFLDIDIDGDIDIDACRRI